MNNSAAVSPHLFFPVSVSRSNISFCPREQKKKLLQTTQKARLKIPVIIQQMGLELHHCSATDDRCEGEKKRKTSSLKMARGCWTKTRLLMLTGKIKDVIHRTRIQIY